MKLESWHSAADKKPWKIVRTDSYVDVPGEIVTADEDTGDCSVSLPKIDDKGLRAVDAEGKTIYETKSLSFGPRGIRITTRKR